MSGATLAALGLAGLPALGPAPNPEGVVTGLSVDSRETRPGHVFAALKGVKLDGAEFAQYAIRMGAAAVLTDLEGALRARETVGGFPVPFLIDEDPRRRLALTAARFFEAQPTTMVAVTGTNGKTSVASFARQLWTALGERAVNLGTVGVEGAVEAPMSETTPEPIRLHGLLADLAAAGVTRAAMEASSHGLAQRRTDGVRFAAGALTNLQRDHLDYHRDIADYAAAKLGLFARVLPEGAAAVANADDLTFEAISGLARSRGLRLIPVGETAREGLTIRRVAPHEGGMTLDYLWEGRERRAELGLIGRFQAWNALVAAGLVIGAGAEAEETLAALPKLVSVRGRMERVARRANGAEVFVDYAHTPDALAAALSALRAHTPGRLVVVFGAGGDRDAGKRPLMGRAAAEAADLAIVTDDNPRSEDPATIRRAVMAGCPEAEEVGDRAEAILRGVDMLEPGDRLLIAGKGHETGQTLAGATIPFDDAEQARVAVTALEGLDRNGTGEDRP